MHTKTTAGALLVLGLVAATAAAEDACLTGASVTADQRALRALRAATETVCPCTAFAGVGRGSFRRCARGQVEAALASGALRGPCRRAALGDVKGATCGTARVACGCVRTSSRILVDCKVTAATGCRDRPGTDETPCPRQTHCSDVVEWTAGTCVDTRVAGPRNVGAHVLALTKTSVVTGLARVLGTIVWYPTAATGPIDAATAAIRDAPLDRSGGPHPLLLYSHGACGIPNGARFLMPLLASYGFVVASPAHAGGTLLDYPTCFETAALIDSARERPADAIFVLDALLAAAADPASPFFAAIDGTRVGMSGHSFGGYTTFAAVAADPRFRVALLLAPAVPAPVPALSVPSLFMLGEVDAVGSVGGHDTTNDARRLAYAAAAPPKMLVEILDAGHFAFSDGCFPGLSLPDCNYPVTLSQDEAHAVVRRWVLPFLQRYLRSDASWEPFLSLPGPPGVRAERVS